MSPPLISLIATKLQPPKAGRQGVLRDHLLGQLEKNLDRSVVLIMGPAGYGKTTLMAQWFEQLGRRGVNCSWLTLSPQDNGEAQFLSYFASSIKQLDQNLALKIEELFESHSSLDPQALVAALVNAVAESSEHYALFLDDYQWIENPDIHNMIQHLFLNLPENITLCIGSRILPPFSLARLKVQGRTLLIGAEGVRFTPQEAAAFIDAHLNTQLSAIEQDKLYQQTQGWPAALQLATSLLETSQDPAGFLADFSGSHNSITDYLAEEVFHRLPKATLELLVRLSLFDRFSAPLCEAIVSTSGSREILENTRNEGLLLQRLEGTGGWYQFHPLAREFLIRSPKLTSTDRQQLHRKAAQWFIDQGYIGESVEHCLKSGDEQSAFDLLRQHAGSLLKQGQLGILGSLVQKLSQGKISSSVQILLPLAWVRLLNHDLTGVNSVLKQIDVLLGQSHGQVRLSIEAEIAAIRASLHATQDQLSAAQSTIDQWHTRIPENNYFIRAVMANCVNYIELCESRFDQLQVTQGQADPLHQQLEDSGAQVYSLFFTGLAQTEQLRLADAEAVYQKASQISGSSHSRRSVSKQLADVMLGTIAYLKGDLEVARNRFETQRSALNRNALTDQILHALPCLVRLYQHQGMIQKAQTLLATYLHPAHERRTVRVLACAVHEQVRLLINQNPAYAKTFLEQQRDRILNGTCEDQAIFEQTQEWLQMAEARILLHQGNFIETEAILSPLLARLQQQGRTLKTLPPLLLLAHSALSQKNETLALSYLNQALDLDPARLALQMFADEGRPLEALFVQNIQTQGPWAAQSQQVIELLQNQASVGKSKQASSYTPSALIPALEEPLTKKETRVLELVSKGMSNREVAEQACVSVETIKSHLRSIYQKMGATRRTQAVHLAREMGLIE